MWNVFLVAFLLAAQNQSLSALSFSYQSNSVVDPTTSSHLNSSNRRQLLSSVTNGISILALNNLVTQSAVAREIGSPDCPVAIIGGGGRTGMAVAETLAGELGQMNGVIMTRTGKDPFKVIKLPTSTKDRLVAFDKPVDVRDPEGVLAALKDSKAKIVVFAASASKQGGNSYDVDEKGVANVASACKGVGAKLILVSALAVDRPDSKSFKITNNIGGYLDKIMDAKLNGEMQAKEILGNNYVIIRPGVLLSGKSKNGASDIVLNQGDFIGGGLSRDELAGVIIGAIQSERSGITVETYRKSTATKLQPEFDISSGNELTASTYKGLFEHANND